MIHKYLKSCFATVVLGATLCSPAAHAVDFNLVSAGSSDSESVLLAANGFFGTKDFSFKLDLLGATAAVSTINLGAVAVSVGGNVKLYNATAAGIATSFTGFSTNLPLVAIGTYASWAPVNDGYYVLRVKSGLLSAALLSTITATAVPEAETYAMMLAGLGLVGTMVARRRQA